MDVTLRDGSYAVDFRFDPNFVSTYLKKVDCTDIQYIEIGHGLGVDAELNGAPPCNISLLDWSRLAESFLTTAKWGLFAQPSFSKLSTLEQLTENGMSFVRIGMRAEAVESNQDYLQQALDSCSSVFLNLMKTSATPINEVAEHLRTAPSSLAGIYVVDSFGAMLPDQVRNYVREVGAVHPTVGFHGHDNLGLANANSLAAVEAGAQLIDGTLNGVGRGAGNAQLESLSAILNRLDSGEHSYRKLADLAEYCRLSLSPVEEERSLQVLGGMLGVHSELFPQVEAISSEMNIDAESVMHVAKRLTDACNDQRSLREAVEDDRQN